MLAVPTMSLGAPPPEPYQQSARPLQANHVWSCLSTRTHDGRTVRLLTLYLQLAAEGGLLLAVPTIVALLSLAGWRAAALTLAGALQPCTGIAGGSTGSRPAPRLGWSPWPSKAFGKRG